MNTKQYDNGGNVSTDNGIADVNLSGIGSRPNFLSSNYQPARSVGRGVAVADPVDPVQVALQQRATIPGIMGPRSGAEIQRILSTYDPGNLGFQLATGYRQMFGRDIDPGGANYWLRDLANKNLTQAEVNRYLAGGAQGSDIPKAQNYAMSLTGGRPDISQGQYFQPIYQSPGYANYRMMPFNQTVGASPLRGFNPFAFTYAPPVQASYGRFKAGGRIEDGIRSVRYR